MGLRLLAALGLGSALPLTAIFKSKGKESLCIMSFIFFYRALDCVILLIILPQAWHLSRALHWLRCTPRGRPWYGLPLPRQCITHYSW